MYITKVTPRDPYLKPNGDLRVLQPVLLLYRICVKPVCQLAATLPQGLFQEREM